MRGWAVTCVLATTVLTVPAHTTPRVVIHVDDDAAPGGNGERKLPYRTLPDALDAARVVPGRVTISVAPGNYPLASTLVIDRDVDLRGSTEQIAAADHWPTGDVIPGTATRIFASNPALTRLLLVDSGNGSVLGDVSIRGFIFEGTVGGISILLNRVQGYQIAGNVFRAPANFGMQSVASSGRVSGNHFSGVGTGAIFAGGYAGSPSDVVFQGNRAVRNSLGGVLLNGASINIPEPGDEIHAVVRDNDLSANIGTQGFGLRVFILRRDPGVPGDTQSAASVHARIQGNRIVGNRMGISIDAGFPYRHFDETTCDTRVYSGSVDLQLATNVLSGSVLTPALITFTRNSAALNQSTLFDWQYLHGATFTIDDEDGMLAGARIDHPATDPFLGSCPADATQEFLGNVLIYNGEVRANGRNF